ncbi:hypothetical protein M514_02875 [Trichuris suis]|uniref:Chromo shadow domain-containing protein n=1 Tax=Trichuris suis TaxID=68888 RepID=A0A085MFV1_9BILA|nr:hypothetical protein M513_02875 [Trichuris suis]KFD66624.1 hypothetical protein M514_02875 [Trichuris suis]
MEEPTATTSNAETDSKEVDVKKEQTSPAPKGRAMPRRRSTRTASLQFQRKMRLKDTVWKPRTNIACSPIKRTLLNRSSARQSRSLLHLDSADESAPEATYELPVAAEVEDIIEPKLGPDGHLFFCIKFFNKDETELVPKEVAYKKYPREMIEFYERILEFSVRPMRS